MYRDQYRPPYEVTEEILNSLIEVGDLAEAYQDSLKRSSIPHLRKNSKIRSVYSSLAIENNQLSEGQVTALLDGKHVLGKQKDILEVQNAFNAYEILTDLDPNSEDDFLRAHNILTRNLVSHPGNYRTGQVGVFDGDKVIHMGSPAKLIPQLMAQLFSWLRSSRVHPLIKSSVFHYEMVFIHPFEDGNGRIARLWQSNILRTWNPVFEFLPIETLIYENQNKYYDAIQESNRAGDSTAFISFMLEMILRTLKEASVQSVSEVNDDVNCEVNSEVNPEDISKRILDLIRNNPKIRINEIREKLNVSKSTVDRRIADLKKKGILKRKGNKRSGEWLISEEESD